MKVVAITQARYGSNRFPGKILKTVNGKSLLQVHLERVKQSKYLDDIIVATTFEEGANEIEQIATRLNVKVYRGSTLDVLERYYRSVETSNADYIVRITSDCPLIDPELMDNVIEAGLKGGFDYFANIVELSFPDGTDVELIKFSALKQAFEEAKLPAEREHVTLYIRENSSFFGKETFTSGSYKSDSDYSGYRLTVDYPSDYELIKILIENLGDKESWKSYVKYLDDHPEIKNLNTTKKQCT